MEEDSAAAPGIPGEAIANAKVIDLRPRLDARQALEQRLLQARKAEAIGQLAVGITHDLANLLAVVTGRLDLLEGQLGEHPGVRDHVSDCRRAVDRAAALTRGTLAFLRERELHPEPFDLRPAVDDVLDLLRPTLGKQIRVRVDHAGELWPCLADRAQMLSALLNLAVNARDAMPVRGTLLVETRGARLSDQGDAAIPGAAAGDYVVLAITDTGAGMTREVLAKACEPFFTAKTADRGNGLGLAMVQGFARRSGGILTIDSEPGKGTTVRLYLPRARQAVERQP